MPRISPRLRSVGEVLRERREELGLGLDGIGETLRIKPAYLVALEQGRSHELPGPAYAIGFIRAYAHYLGMDEEAVLARFKDESSVLTARPDLSLPVPLGERSLPGAAMLLVALILVMCGYGTWYYLSTGERTRPERVSAVPAVLQQPSIVAGGALPAEKPGPGVAEPVAVAAAPDAAPAAPGIVAGPAAAAAPPPAPAPAPAAAPQPAAPAAAKPVPPPVVNARLTPAPAAAPAVLAPGQSRVVIRALADCWIQVRAPDQAIVFSRVLKSGETYKVPPKPGLFLRTGNAGALEIAVDGKPAPSIGGVGTLRRDVLLEPGALVAGTAIRG